MGEAVSRAEPMAMSARLASYGVDTSGGWQPDSSQLTPAQRKRATKKARRALVYYADRPSPPPEPDPLASLPELQDGFRMVPTDPPPKPIAVIRWAKNAVRRQPARASWRAPSTQRRDKVQVTGTGRGQTN
jgi:hypothetical protein